MSESFPEHILDTNAFLTATFKAVDQEYDYVIAKVGQETLVRDLEARRIARKAIGLLKYIDFESFQEDMDVLPFSDESITISASDEASLEYLRLLADKLGTINGYQLTLITDTKLIIDQIVRIKDSYLMVISLEASLSSNGIDVAKDRHIVMQKDPVMRDPLEVTPEDIDVINKFIQKITSTE